MENVTVIMSDKSELIIPLSNLQNFKRLHPDTFSGIKEDSKQVVIPVANVPVEVVQTPVEVKQVAHVANPVPNKKPINKK